MSHVFIIKTWDIIVSFVYFSDEVACVDPDICEEVCGNPNGCSNIAYPRMLVYLMPAGKL